MDVSAITIVVLGALCGGFVTGLAGFGTGLTALGLWLYVVEPVVAAALVVTCSVIAQVQSLHAVRRAVTWRRVWPFLLGGLVGVPLGVAALRLVDPKTLKILLGLLLVGYTGTAQAVGEWIGARAGRAAAMWMIKRMQVDGWDSKMAGEEAAALGLANERLKQFAIDWVATHKK